MSKAERSIGEKMAQLDELLAWFSGDGFELEAAAIKFAEAEKLAKEIEEDLKGIKNSISIISQRFSQETE